MLHVVVAVVASAAFAAGGSAVSRTVAPNLFPGGRPCSLASDGTPHRQRWLGIQPGRLHGLLPRMG